MGELEVTITVQVYNLFVFFSTSDSNELTVSVDAAWQTRGSGRSFDSLSGIGIIILILLCPPPTGEGIKCYP